MLQVVKRASEAELKLFFEDCIPSARDAYSSAGRIESYQKNLMSVLASLSLQNIIKIITDSTSLQINDDLPHHIFVIQPGEIRSEHVVEFASQYWLDIVAGIVKKGKVDIAAQALFEVFTRNNFTRGAAGQLLDTIVRDSFAQGGVWKIQQMETSKHKGTQNHRWKILRSSTYTDKYLILGRPDRPLLISDMCPSKDVALQPTKTHIQGCPRVYLRITCNEYLFS
jgi:hypothetical protein